MTESPPSSPATILIIDDDAEIRYSLQRVLQARGYASLAAESGEKGIEVARDQNVDVIFLDNRMEGISGLETLQHLRGLKKSFMVVLMTAYGTTQTAIEAMKFGAFDYIVKPFDAQRVLSIAEAALTALRDQRQAETETYEPLLQTEDYRDGLVGASQPMQEVFKTIGQVAASDATVMITGESGTGKELVARCLWQHSARTQDTFIAVNCAAIPENLIESELFGHERGSFTGATQQRTGKFELCDGGTLFLDEIGDMSLQTQTKILRALQEKEIQRVGGSSVIKVDVRLIAATNKPLEEMVKSGEFREDLYYRLNVVRIRLPALRERLDDVPQLVDFMLQRLRSEKKTQVRQLSVEAMAALMQHPWPGNVRELENVIHRSAIVSQSERILIKDLPPDVRDKKAPDLPSYPVEDSPRVPETTTTAAPAPPQSEPVARAVDPASTGPGPLIGNSATGSIDPDSMPRSEAYDLIYQAARADHDKSILQELEREMILRALKETGGNQVKSSAILGITRATLRKRIDQHSLRY